MSRPADLRDDLVCFWDFSEEPGSARQSKTRHAYALTEMAGAVERIDEGPFGHAARLKEGQWFNLPSAACPALNFGGPEGEVTLVAWLKREAKSNGQCEAVAGRWNETDRGRQYCLFLNLGIWDSREQVCAHVSNIGGPTPGFKYCMDAAIGATPVPLGEWVCCAMTYGNGEARAYLDGRLDERHDQERGISRNPYAYPGGPFADDPISDFTVGGVFRSGSMSNWFTGAIGGLAIWKRALSADAIKTIASADRATLKTIAGV